MTPSWDDDVRPAETGESEELEEEPRRSIFAATWFRLLIVVVVVGAITAVSVPYLMESMRVSPPPIVAPSQSPAVVTNTPSAPSATTPAPLPATTSSSPTDQAKPPDEATTASAGTSPPKPPATTTAPPPAPSAPPPSADPATPGTASRSAPPTQSTAPPMPAAPAATAKPSPTPDRGSTATPSEKVAKRDAATPPATGRAVASSTERVGDERGDFWVQVGAFRNPETARQVAARLREKSFRVDESNLAPSPPAASTAAPSAVAAPGAVPSTGAVTDLYRVVVTDASAGDLASKVSVRGFTAEASPEGAVIRPMLPLRDAVALSQQLAADGFKVQVKRSRAADGQPGSPPRPVPPTAKAEDDTLHRVRVGAFRDRASAVVALRKLQALGYTPFIAQGRE